MGLGSGWERLIERMREFQHDLVIAGTRDRSPIARLLFGGAGMKLLRCCPCAVWSRGSLSCDDARTVILAAHDLTDVGQRALELAASIGAKCASGTLLVFHAFETTPRHGLAGSDVAAAESRMRHNDAREKLLDSNCNAGKLVRAPYELIIREGRPDLELASADRAARNVDTVVMGMRSRTGLGAMLIGNTSERLLPELNCSALAVEPEDQESRV